MLKGSPSSSEDADRLQFLWKEVQSLVSTSWTNAFESRLELISLATSFFVTPEHVLPEDLDRLPQAWREAGGEEHVTIAPGQSSPVISSFPARLVSRVESLAPMAGSPKLHAVRLPARMGMFMKQNLGRGAYL
jgi:hypothetical protein